MKPEAYRRNLAARAFDVARYLLFWGVPTNVGQVASIRTVEKQIRRLKASEYAELRSLGEEIAEACAREPDCRWDENAAAEPLAPTLARHAEPDEHAIRSRHDLRQWAAQNLPPRAATAEPPRVDLVRPAQVAADIVATLLYPVTDRPFRELYEMACAWSEARRAEVIDVALQSRTRRDEILSGFRGGLFAYDFVIDIGAYRDMQRHRRCQKFRQEYSGALGYETPALVAEAGASEIYERAMNAAFDRHARPARARRPLPAALRRAIAFPLQNGFRRSRIHLPPAQRRKRPFQLPPNRLGHENRHGVPGARTRPPHRSHAAVGGRSAEAVRITPQPPPVGAGHMPGPPAAKNFRAESGTHV